MPYTPDHWTNGPSATYAELLDLLGDAKGNATSIELDRLLAAGLTDPVLRSDAKRPPEGGRSSSATEVATSLANLREASIAGDPGALQNNKECNR